MMQYDSDNLIVHSQDGELIVEVTPEKAGWEYVHFEARRIARGGTWGRETGSCEAALVVFGGKLSVESNRGAWRHVGKRRNVFEGLPYALYLPRQTVFSLIAETDCEFGFAWVPAEEDHPARLITPDDVTVEIRGGDNATRQINGIIPPGFDCRRLVIVEVYTPSGGWSSYPPHKHDVHKIDRDGRVIEADLEEIYFYKIDRQEGYAYQRIYTDPESPLHMAGHPIDALVLARNNDVVLVPEGYHPVVSAPGYTTYYLNVLAGSAQSLANSDDPRYAWVKDSYTGRNPAVPVYEV
jgi:5-deoxy-glucuronate isomerase